ncbi:hypothetical protein Tco_1075967 [Tanacetum coccineum]
MISSQASLFDSIILRLTISPEARFPADSKLPCSKTYLRLTISPNVWLVPSCCVIFDLKPLSLSFNFVFCSENFKSFPCLSLSSLHLAILCLDQHAHTLHHFESLLTISLDNHCLDNLDILKEDLEYQSLRKSLSLNFRFIDS